MVMVPKLFMRSGSSYSAHVYRLKDLASGLPLAAVPALVAAAAAVVADELDELSPPQAARNARLAAPRPATPRKPRRVSIDCSRWAPRPSARILSSSSAMRVSCSAFGVRLVGHA